MVNAVTGEREPRADGFHQPPPAAQAAAQWPYPCASGLGILHHRHGEAPEIFSRSLSPEVFLSLHFNSHFDWKGSCGGVASDCEAEDMTPGAFEEFLRHLLQMLKNDQHLDMEVEPVTLN